MGRGEQEFVQVAAWPHSGVHLITQTHLSSNQSSRGVVSLSLNQRTVFPAWRGLVFSLIVNTKHSTLEWTHLSMVLSEVCLLPVMTLFNAFLWNARLRSGVRSHGTPKPKGSIATATPADGTVAATLNGSQLAHD